MRNIVLIGFMGTGKTSTGKLLANRIGYSFVDTDAQIEAENQMAIQELFAAYGEAYFRTKESEMIQKLAACSQTVISTGGGVVLNPENMKALRQNGVVISLTASVDVILERTGRRNSRPLLQRANRRETVSDLMQARADLYGEADFFIDTSGISPLKVSDKIMEFLKRGHTGYARG